jgi:S-adenosylmethionine-dependent methyltransferase
MNKMKKNSKPDQSFNNIADKFEKNIYGTSKGRLRHELLLHYMQTHMDLATSKLQILDAGGGTGVMARSLVDLGHQLSINDISEDVLTLAREKFRDDSSISFIHGEIQNLDPALSYDVVVCHAVLEWLQEPLQGVAALLERVKPGGYLSLSFFNKHAYRFANLLYGNFDHVKADMQGKNRVRLSPNNALFPEVVIGYLQSLPVTIVNKAGIRCFHDYLKDRQLRDSHYEKIKQAEIEYGCQEPYLWLGKYFHIIVQKDA